ncbi:MAG: hypothetical protein V2A74_10920 [bacterium]
MRFLKSLIFIILFVALGAAALTIQHKKLRETQLYRPYRDSLYLPGPNFVKTFVLGYDEIAADFLWLRSIQAFGGRFHREDLGYGPLINLFNVITDLDPRFVDAYTFGNMVIGEEGGHQQEGLNLLDKGIVKTLNQYYKLPFWGAYVTVWETGNYNLGRYYVKRAIKAPDCPEWVGRWLNYIELKSGRYHVACEQWLRNYLEALGNNDAFMIDLTRSRLKDTLMDWHISILREAAKKYYEKFANKPQNLQDLVSTKELETYDTLDLAKLEEAIRSFQAQGGKLEDRFEQIVKAGTITTDQIPPEPNGLFYHIIAASPEEEKSLPPNEPAINSATRTRQGVRQFLATVRGQIQIIQQEQGHYPQSLQELYPGGMRSAEPFGGQWLYNPFTGDIRSSVMPDL